jgi:hypothetical protein
MLHDCTVFRSILSCPLQDFSQVLYLLVQLYWTYLYPSHYTSIKSSRLPVRAQCIVRLLQRKSRPKLCFYSLGSLCLDLGPTFPWNWNSWCLYMTYIEPHTSLIEPFIIYLSMLVETWWLSTFIFLNLFVCCCFFQVKSGIFYGAELTASHMM